MTWGQIGMRSSSATTKYTSHNVLYYTAYAVNILPDLKSSNLYIMHDSGDELLVVSWEMALSKDVTNI